MRICLIATEFKGIGPCGGFGVLTSDIAAGLAAKGLDVYVVVPRKDGQSPVERIGDVTVLSYPSPLYVGMKEVLRFTGVYRMLGADIYHSEEPSLGTALAQIACPDKKHLVTFQDPRTIEDWRKQWAPAKPSRLHEWQFQYHYQRATGEAARCANARYCQAKYIIEKAMRVFRLTEKPGFLPNPVKISPIRIPKSTEPTVCYVGRWDTIKRPELFLELAKRFPMVKFVIVGACLSDPQKDADIRQQCQQLKNVEAPGWLLPEQRDKILDRAWVLINTSIKECLPVTYLEAGAHKCAILSHGNADDFASNFGYWAQRGTPDDFEQGVKFILKDNEWKNRGEKAYSYVLSTHEYDRVINQHIEVYEQMLEKPQPRPFVDNPTRQF